MTSDVIGTRLNNSGVVGDRVAVTLVGELVDYDAELGIWTLRGCAESGHVTWDYHLHWSSEFQEVPR